MSANDDSACVSDHDKSMDELIRENADLRQQLAERTAEHETLNRKIFFYREAERFAHVGHWEWDRIHDRMISCSTEYARIMGLSVEAAIEQTSSVEIDMEEVHPDDRENYLAVLDLFEKSEGAEKLDVEYRMASQDGGYRHIHERGDTILDDSGNDVGSYGIMHDITDRKETEQALQDSKDRLNIQLVELRDREERLEEQANQLVELAEDASIYRDELSALNEQKDKFFAIVAHDLKSPFNALPGFSQMLATQTEALSREQVADYGSMVYRAAEQAYKLLEDLLEWSRLQLDRIEFAPEPIDMGPLLETVRERYGPVAKSKNLSIEIVAPSTATALADQQMIATVLRNLINNSIKFTEPGGRISLSAAVTNNMIDVTVSDTGVGMPKDKADILFDLSEKTTTKGTDGESGTGLGLQLCRELISKHGGEIKVESVEGEGSTFHFTLPAV